MDIAAFMHDYLRQQEREKTFRRFADLRVFVPGYGIGLTLGLELGAGIERAQVGVAIRHEPYANDADGIRFSGARYLAQPKEVLILDDVDFREAMAWGQPLIPDLATMVDRRRARDLHRLNEDHVRDLETFVGPMSPTQDPDEIDRPTIVQGLRAAIRAAVKFGHLPDLKWTVVPQGGIFIDIRTASSRALTSSGIRGYTPEWDAARAAIEAELSPHLQALTDIVCPYLVCVGGSWRPNVDIAFTGPLPGPSTDLSPAGHRNRVESDYAEKRAMLLATACPFPTIRDRLDFYADILARVAEDAPQAA